MKFNVLFLFVVPSETEPWEKARAFFFLDVHAWKRASIRLYHAAHETRAGELHLSYIVGIPWGM